MTPKEKAKELINIFREFADGTDPETEYSIRYSSNIEKENGKKCALKAVDEILNSFSNIFDDSVIESSKVGGYRNMKKYWQEVKQEIEKL
jgi:hypothetical protein